MTRETFHQTFHRYATVPVAPLSVEVGFWIYRQLKFSVNDLVDAIKLMNAQQYINPFMVVVMLAGKETTGHSAAALLKRAMSKQFKSGTMNRYPDFCRQHALDYCEVHCG